MKKTIFISLVVLCLSTTGVRAANILFVTSEDNPLDAEDAPLVTFLAGLGHTVILIDDDEDESTTEAAALQADVVFISESVSSGKIRTEITEIATPMVVAEAWGWDETGLTTNTTGGLAATSTDIEIVAPGRLGCGQTWYWRVDEIGAALVSKIIKGNVWRFTVEPFARPITADRITATASSSLNADSQPGKTADRSGLNASDQHDTVDGPIMESTIMHGGRQSMPFSYDNTAGKISEATRPFDTAQDWTVSGIKSLSLWFYGAADNAGQLYVKINNTKVLYKGGAADIKQAQWQPWHIDGINIDNWTADCAGIHCKLYNGRAHVGVWGVPGGDLNGTTIVDSEEWIHPGLR